MQNYNFRGGCFVWITLGLSCTNETLGSTIWRFKHTLDHDACSNRVQKQSGLGGTMQRSIPAQSKQPSATRLARGSHNCFSHPPTMRRGHSGRKVAADPSLFQLPYLHVTLVTGNHHRRRLPKVQPALVDGITLKEDG